MNYSLKKKISETLCFFRADYLFRFLNRNKLLIVTYHGVFSDNKYDSGLFTHIHIDLFREHVSFLKENYNIITVSDLTDAISNRKKLPPYSALITFDDGFENNYDLAFPILQELRLPASIFLTVDYIGTKNLLWFDELFLILRQAVKCNIDPRKISHSLSNTCYSLEMGTLYRIVSQQYKKMTNAERVRKISDLKKLVDICYDPLHDQFKLLSWEQVREMKSSGLVEFGVHTATHRILSGLSDTEFEAEIIKPKKTLESKLSCEMTSFCYPNGTPDVDFYSTHEEFLASNGYLCSFSTQEKLNPDGYNPYRLCRMSIGNDVTSDINFFKLNVSGLLLFLNKLKFIFF